MWAGSTSAVEHSGRPLIAMKGISRLLMFVLGMVEIPHFQAKRSSVMPAQADIQVHHPQGYRFSTMWTLPVTWISCLLLRGRRKRKSRLGVERSFIQIKKNKLFGGRHKAYYLT